MGIGKLVGHFLLDVRLRAEKRERRTERDGVVLVEISSRERECRNRGSE